METTKDYNVNNSDNAPRLLFVGSPMLDISAGCDDALLRRFDLKQDDCVRAREEHDPLFQDLFLNEHSKLAAGGSAQNAARVAKWTLGKAGEVAFAGCAGNDNFESWMRLKLVSEGVLPLYVKDPMTSTGVCACLLTPKGERSMCARQGAAALFSTGHLRTDLIRPHLDRADCVFVEGYFLGHSAEVVMELAERRDPHQLFSLSLSAEYVCRTYVDLLERVIPNVNVLLGNQAEVKAFAIAKGARNDVTVEEAVRIVRQLQTKSHTSQPCILVVTRGSKPLIMVHEATNNQRVFDIPQNIPVVDSVGCGDALSGAFLASYVGNRDVDKAVRVGIDAAVQILQAPGCDPPTNKKCDTSEDYSSLKLNGCLGRVD